ncbi:MAG TPA: hypothetical protein VHO25_16920, partial [Polyangiaceae bacterium]|nr:hypothetical protein [Polyangiaceae bacterium]
GLSETEVAGLVFHPDGSFQFLVADGSGGLARATGFQREGNWNVLDSSDPSSPTKYFQTDVSLAGSGGNHLSLTFSSEPEKMSMNWMGGNAVYAALPPADAQPDSGP